RPAHLLSRVLWPGGLRAGCGVMGRALTCALGPGDGALAEPPGRGQTKKQGRGSQGCAAECSRICTPDHRVSRPPCRSSYSVWTASELLVGAAVVVRKRLKLVQ